MQVVIERAGLSWLIDRGARGSAQHGLPEGGPQDGRAAFAAWAWAGEMNGVEPWWLEIGPLPFAVHFTRPVRVVVLGAGRAVQLSGKDLPAGEGDVLGCRFSVDAGARLHLGPAPLGGPTYLTARAGLAGLPEIDDDDGGAMVRRLRSGDELPLLAPDDGVSGKPGRWLALLDARVARHVWMREDCVHVRFVAGPEYEVIRQHVSPGCEGLVSEGEQRWEFVVSRQMDRRAVRLTPPPGGMERRSSPIFLAESSPTVTGLIQWPAGGQPIILRADRQTMGGYPRFGSVIAADRRRLAWLRPGEALSLHRVERAEAMRAYEREKRADELLQQFFRFAGMTLGVQ